MSYDSKNYRGTLEGVRPLGRGFNILASPATTDSFVDIIQSVRPEGVADSEGFSEVLQHDDRRIVVELHPDDEYQRLELGEPPLGMAVAHNVARRRRFLWKKGLAPGMYTVTKTVFAEQTADQTDRQTHVQENIRSFVTLGQPVDTLSTRRANEDEVVAAIDTIFMAAAMVTTEYTPVGTPDNPMIAPQTWY
jgi:hypothetical protein